MASRTLPLLLIRHGQTEWNLMKRWQGRAESQLTDLGRAEAARAALHLADMEPFDEIWASPLIRAHDTAKILSSTLGVSPVHTDPRLIETDVGAWEGLTLAELERGWPGYLAQRRQPEGFEPDQDVIARITSFCEDRIASGHHCLAVCHSGVMRTLRRHLGVSDHRISNLGGYWLGPGQMRPLQASELFSFVTAGAHGSGARDISLHQTGHSDVNESSDSDSL
jgi:broad specificity phosphatase PhoE